MAKTDIRNRFIEIRGDIPTGAVASSNEKIMRLVTSTITWPTKGSVHSYRSAALWNEVDTSWLAAYMAEHCPDCKLTVGNPNRSIPIPKNEFDIIFVPVLAFDQGLNRLGFGGGWYDRFLANQQHALKIGLAYDAQEYAGLPVEPHDIAMDMIITQTRVLRK